MIRTNQRALSAVAVDDTEDNLVPSASLMTLLPSAALRHNQRLCLRQCEWGGGRRVRSVGSLPANTLTQQHQHGCVHVPRTSCGCDARGLFLIEAADTDSEHVVVFGGMFVSSVHDANRRRQTPGLFFSMQQTE